MGQHFYTYPTVVELRPDLNQHTGWAGTADNRSEPPVHDAAPAGAFPDSRPSERTEW
jgi:hypothetical protein